jgi:hypothetical protein
LNFVFVHGIQQGKESSKRLEKIWLGALKPRTLSPVAVPFYGRKLDDYVKGNRSVGLGADYREFAAEFGADVIGASVAEVRQLQKEAPEHRDLQNLWVVRAFARFTDGKVPVFADIFITRFLKEVHTYLTNAQARPEVERIVESDIAKMCERGPTVVIGHSLGSVVAYNVLRAKDYPNVRHFVTLGSPLAISAVTKRIPVDPQGRRISLNEWFNGFDPRDIVALNPLSEVQLGSTCRIDNVGELENVTENRHGIIGYLGIDSVASYLVEKLGELK